MLTYTDGIEMRGLNLRTKKKIARLQGRAGIGDQTLSTPEWIQAQSGAEREAIADAFYQGIDEWSRAGGEVIEYDGP